MFKLHASNEMTYDFSPIFPEKNHSSMHGGDSTSASNGNTGNTDNPGSNGNPSSNGSNGSNNEQNGVMVDLSGQSFVGKKRPMEFRTQDITNLLEDKDTIMEQFTPLKYTNNAVHPVGGVLERTNALLEKERRMKASKWAAPFKDAFTIDPSAVNPQTPRGFGEKLATFTGNFPLQSGGGKQVIEGMFETTPTQFPLQDVHIVQSNRIDNSKFKNKEKPFESKQVSANLDFSNFNPYQNVEFLNAYFVFGLTRCHFF